MATNDYIDNLTKRLKELEREFPGAINGLRNSGREMNETAKDAKDLADKMAGVKTAFQKSSEAMNEFSSKVGSVMSGVVSDIDKLATAVPTTALAAQLNKIDERWKANRKVVMDVGLAWRNEFKSMLTSANTWDYRMSNCRLICIQT